MLQMSVFLIRLSHLLTPHFRSQGWLISIHTPAYIGLPPRSVRWTYVLQHRNKLQDKFWCARYSGSRWRRTPANWGERIYSYIHISKSLPMNPFKLRIPTKFEDCVLKFPCFSTRCLITNGHMNFSQILSTPIVATSDQNSKILWIFFFSRTCRGFLYNVSCEKSESKANVQATGQQTPTCTESMSCWTLIRRLCRGWSR